MHGSKKFLQNIFCIFISAKQGQNIHVFRDRWEPENGEDFPCGSGSHIREGSDSTDES